MTASAREVEVTITRIGARGDGIAAHAGQSVYVPYSRTGDRLRVRLEQARGAGWVGAPVAWIERAPRAEPPCPHFGSCGGCQLQHLPAPDYLAWKHAQVVEALAHHGLEQVEVDPVIATPPGSRRRARLVFRGHGTELRLGFRRRSAHAPVDVRACPVLAPGLVALLPPLREALSEVDSARRGGEAVLTLGAAGIELVLLTAAQPTLGDRERLAGFAETLDLAGLWWAPDAAREPEPLAVRRPLAITTGPVPLAPPPGGFVQASAPAEAALVVAVEAIVGKGRRVADLFAGCGTFSLPLAAAGRQVIAYERDRVALASLATAASVARLTEWIAIEPRDLDRSPLAATELARFEAVVLDPPRAGARAQCVALAASPVPVIAMVSCHPATFARDAALLTAGGYRCDQVQPIDAFLWSARIELVAGFRRDPDPANLGGTA